MFISLVCRQPLRLVFHANTNTMLATKLPLARLGLHKVGVLRFSSVVVAYDWVRGGTVFTHAYARTHAYCVVCERCVYARACLQNSVATQREGQAGEEAVGHRTVCVCVCVCVCVRARVHVRA